MAERSNKQPEIDKIIHERTRLLILSYLAAGEVRRVPFTELKETLELTAGNLSVHLRNLEDAGYIKISKRIVGRKPATDIIIATEGMTALNRYLAEMESLINRVKSSGDTGGR
ncbi:MAG: transcriptional regulator [Bacillota bacterium]